MARLIDGDALLKNIRRAVYPSDLATTIAVGICESHVKDMPTIDAAPVVHARWETDYSWHGHCRCSNCHGTSIEAEWLNRYMWPYCPNCGAQMNRGDDDATD